MAGPRQIDPHHIGARTFFRTAGPLLLVVGGVFMLVGFVDFVRSMNSFGPPTLFWCFFVGMPLLFFGFVCTNLGYMGRMARYVSQETTPVATDTFNYAARHTKDGVRDLAQAVGEGLRGTTPAPADLACPACLHNNDADARFCSECGTALGTRRECPNCRHENDLDANFCDNCGQALGA